MGTEHKEHPIKSISDFIDKIDADSPLVLFRGQSFDDPLVPKVARPFPVGATGPAKVRYISQVIERERWLFEEFERQAKNLDDMTSLSADEGDILSVAQHYGLPTRLLDWTQNPLAALFFAVDYDRAKDKEKDPKKKPKPVVWQLVPNADEQLIKSEDRKKFKFRDPSQTMVFRPNHVTTRIRVQSGWFTVHALGARLNKTGSFKGNLRKFVIEADAEELKKRLNRMGVNRASLFPDTGNLAAHLSWDCPYKIEEVK